MYSISQVSQMFNIPVSTLRYYDKEGFFPFLQRQSGIRKFGYNELEALRVIECLKASGLEIKEINRFFELVRQGSSSYSERRQLFLNQLQDIEEELQRLERVKAMVQFKCWYYEKAMADGNEEGIQAMLPDKLPPEIQKLYDLAHEESLCK